MVGFVRGGVALELGHLGGKSFLRGRLIVVVEFAVLRRKEVVGMLFLQSLLVSEGLDCGVVVMLVNLAVHCLRMFLVAVRLDSFMSDRGGNGLLN